MSNQTQEQWERRQVKIRERQRRELGVEPDEVYRLSYKACLLSRAFVRVSRRRDEIELTAGVGLIDFGHFPNGTSTVASTARTG
jgi:hypothetical protein